MRDIAQEAELSTGAVYFYFKSKAEIFGMVCEEAFDILLTVLRKAAAGKGNPVKRCKALVAAYSGFYVEYPDYFGILELGFKKLDLPAPIARRLDDLYLQAISILREIIEQGIKRGFFAAPRGSGWDLTVTLWASIEGLLYLHRMGCLEGLDLDALIRNQMTIFQQGTMPPMAP